MGGSSCHCGRRGCQTAWLSGGCGIDDRAPTKGLEWDAVAVVGLNAGGFPSNQGDHLKVVLDDNHPVALNKPMDSSRIPRERGFVVDQPVAVPVPVRADAGILPRFPHDADVHGDPIDSLRNLDDVELIDDECSAPCANSAMAWKRWIRKLVPDPVRGIWPQTAR